VPGAPFHEFLTGCVTGFILKMIPTVPTFSNPDVALLGYPNPKPMKQYWDSIYPLFGNKLKIINSSNYSLLSYYQIKVPIS
jgi:hypothetical protein